jgi:hypothetical protein
MAAGILALVAHPMLHAGETGTRIWPQVVEMHRAFLSVSHPHLQVIAAMSCAPLSLTDDP